MENRNENRDEWTGLWNHRYALGIVPGILGHNGQVALILADIDRFKDFNDAYGLALSEGKLREIAHEIENLSGENALVFRYGGDEFGVILYESSLENAREIAEKIRTNRKPIMVEMNGGKIEILTLSLGIAHFPTHATDPLNLIGAADLALLKAKQGGQLSDGTPYSSRNRVMAIGDFLDDFPRQSARFLNFSE